MELSITLDTGNGSVAFSGYVVDAHTIDGQLDGSGWVASPMVLGR
jgi:hypothetical protein